MKKRIKIMFFDDEHHQERCSTPKLPLYSLPMTNRATETPGLATPPVNIAGTVPFLWEEAPGKPRARSGDDVTAAVSKGSGKKQNGVVRSLELPPRMSDAAGKMAGNDPSPTTVLHGPYAVRRRSRSLKKGGVKLVKENSGFFGSTRCGSSAKFKEVVEGKLDISRFTVASCAGGGGGKKVKISRVRRKRNLLNLNLSYSKSHFWERVYERFKQLIPWRRRH
ncbi:PREDICTED: uncharacterized protein At4g00950-like [Tarenaya hassleriana]|uniref:uncharacterized protein At4g00950-like n=1 Tax=Tarenaya hassleriana TaxID=28532 RepID=UPI00053C1244|nr:PREDICTED: uncharacterized protein At4g00950-like [Tarenaya hassleriana]